MPTKQKVHLPFKDLHKKSGDIDTSTMDLPQYKKPEGEEQSIFGGKTALNCIDVSGNITRYQHQHGSVFNENFNVMILSDDPQYIWHFYHDQAFSGIFKCDVIFALFRDGIFYLSMSKSYKDTLAAVKAMGSWESIVMLYDLKNLTAEKKASIADQWKCILLKKMNDEENPLDRISGNNALMTVLADNLPKGENSYQILSNGLSMSPMKRKGKKVAKEKKDGTSDNNGRAKKKTKEVQAEAPRVGQENADKKKSAKKASKKDKVSPLCCLSMSASIAIT